MSTKVVGDSTNVIRLEWFAPPSIWIQGFIITAEANGQKVQLAKYRDSVRRNMILRLADADTPLKKAILGSPRVKFHIEAYDIAGVSSRGRNIITNGMNIPVAAVTPAILLKSDASDAEEAEDELEDGR